MMRLLGAALPVILAVGLASCKAPPQPVAAMANAPLNHAAFLAGVWRTDHEGTIVEERWTPACGGLMLGTSVTIRDGSAVFFEFLRIEVRNGTLVYVAQPRGAPPTDFPLVECGANSLSFANPQHDFPKRIHYARNGNQLVATVDAGPDAAPGASPPAESWTMQLQR